MTFEVDAFKNLTVGFVGNFEGEMVDLIGELVEVWICSVLDLKIGFTFKGVFHADSDAVGDFDGSSVRFLVIFLDNFDNCSRAVLSFWFFERYGFAASSVPLLFKFSLGASCGSHGEVAEF